MRVTFQHHNTPVWRIQLSPGQGGDTLIDPAGVEQLAKILAAAQDDEGCRVIVLQGEGGTFCGGADLAYILVHPEEDHTEGLRLYARCLSSLRGCSKVVIAVVDGAATGGGVGLAATADKIIATERSRFGLPEVTLGLLPAMILPALLERLSPQRARLLALWGSVDAHQALDLGLVDQVVQDAVELEKALRSTLKQALRCEPQAVAQLKQLSGRLTGMPLEQGLELGADVAAEVFSDPRRLEHVREFMDGGGLPWFERYKPEATERSEK